MKHLVSTALLCAAITALSGCGYRMGNLGHPQLSTVAVAPVTNDTMAYNGSAVLRGLLCELFTTDGTMKLVSMREADCIVYARIVDFHYRPIGEKRTYTGEKTFLSEEWRCYVEVEFSVVLPGRGKPLIQNRTVQSSAKYITQPDLESSRLSALRQALYRAARTIVSNLTEGW